MLKNKKAQVTLFIIIGLLILVGAIFLIYIRSSEGNNAALTLVQEDVPNEYKPYQDFIIQCVDSISKEGIKKIGLNGGFIDPSNPLYSGKEFKFDMSNPTEGDGIEMKSIGKIPYWYHMYTPNSCDFQCNTTYEFPTLGDIETQLSIYVGEKIESCINVLQESAKEKGVEVTIEYVPKVKTTITTTNVLIELEYPIMITSGNRNHELKNYYVEQPVDFLNIYATSALLTHHEANNRFLEKIFLYTMSNFQGGEFTLLPPFNLIKSGPMIIKWPKTMVELMLKDLLKTYTPLIRLQNTANDFVVEDYNGIVEKNIYDFSRITHKYNFTDLQVRFYYLDDWPFYLHITPNEDNGETIAPNVKSKEMMFMGTMVNSEYFFKYDFSYPIVVEVRDDSAFNGEGFSLFFALESNIKDNRDILAYMLYDMNPGINNFGFNLAPIGMEVNEEAKNIQILDDSYPEGTFEIGEDGKPIIPNDFSTQSAEKPELPRDHIFCDDGQKIGPLVTFDVTDKLTNEPLENAGIFYKCGPFYSCRIGATDSEGILKAKMPLCNGGAVKIESIGYTNYYEEFDSKLGDESDIIKAELFMPFEKKFKILMLDVADLETYVTDELEYNKLFANSFKEDNAYDEVNQDTNVMLMVSKKNENAYSDQFFNAFNLNGINSDLSGTITLLPAEYGSGSGYEVRIIYINNSEHFAKGSGYCKDCCKIIEEEEEDTPQSTQPGELPNINLNLDKPEEECTGTCIALCPEKNKRFDTYNPITMEKTMQGITTINEETTTFLWHIDYEDLADSEKDMVIFYVIKGKLPEYTKDLVDMTDIGKKSKKYRYYIMPDLINSNQIYNKYQRVTLGTS